MQRPAIMDPARGVNRHVIGFGLVGLIAFGIGYLGQGSWGVGATNPSAASAIVTDVVGGAGSRKPVQVKVSLGVTNSGTEQIRVVGPDGNGNGTAVITLSPPRLRIRPGAIGRIDAEVSLDCDLPEPLRMPGLRLELRDGAVREIPVGGSGMLLEACSRAQPAVRPLAATMLAPAVPSDQPTPTTSTPPAQTTTTTTDDGRLAVRLSSPTGRRTRVLAVRAGGVDLRMTPVTVAGKAAVVVQLSAPLTCPVQWQITGIPSSLNLDVVPDPVPKAGQAPSSTTDSRATLRLRLGPALTTWLLATSCTEPP